MSIIDRVRTWWNRDKLERVEEESGMTARERHLAEEDYQERKDDLFTSERVPTGGVDFESDSQPPHHP